MCLLIPGKGVPNRYAFNLPELTIRKGVPPDIIYWLDYSDVKWQLSWRISNKKTQLTNGCLKVSEWSGCSNNSVSALAKHKVKQGKLVSCQHTKHDLF